MSTTLLENVRGVYLNRFYGGEDRGVCYQITQANGIYVQLTTAQMELIVTAFLRDRETKFNAGGELIE